LAGGVVWTIAIGSLPLFIVLIGYHNWRRICPLAFFSQIPVRLRRPGTRRVSGGIEQHYYFLTFATFFVGLWLRLIWTNGDGVAIATFFTGISIAALLMGALFTGKTWCNYICPVSFIEKIYTEPRGLRDTTNSQCAKCTACKTACPDINQENGYWKEIDAPAKRFRLRSIMVGAIGLNEVYGSCRAMSCVCARQRRRAPRRGGLRRRAPPVAAHP
jgi:polyferredoxin